MDKAIELSKENIKKNSGGPFGCVIVKDNQIIAEGVNQVVNTCDPTAHAEICAIRNACKVLNSIDLSECSLYSSCEPCPMCYGAIKWARINYIFYSNTREDASKIGFSDEHIYNLIEQKNTKMHHVPSREALDVFNDWEKDENNVKY